MSSDEEKGYIFGECDVVLPKVFDAIIRDHLVHVRDDTHHKGQGVGLFTYFEGKPSDNVGYYYIKRYSYLWKQLDDEYKLSVPYLDVCSTDTPSHSLSPLERVKLVCVGLKYLRKDDLHTNEEYMFKFYHTDSLEEYIPGESHLPEDFSSEKNDKSE